MANKNLKLVLIVLFRYFLSLPKLVDFFIHVVAQTFPAHNLPGDTWYKNVAILAKQCYKFFLSLTWGGILVQGFVGVGGRKNASDFVFS